MFTVIGYIHTKSRNQDGKGASANMVYEVVADEATANRRAKELVEFGPCLWATYERNND